MAETMHRVRHHNCNVFLFEISPFVMVSLKAGGIETRKVGIRTEYPYN